MICHHSLLFFFQRGTEAIGSSANGGQADFIQRCHAYNYQRTHRGLQSCNEIKPAGIILVGQIIDRYSGIRRRAAIGMRPANLRISRTYLTDSGKAIIDFQINIPGIFRWNDWQNSLVRVGTRTECKTIAITPREKIHSNRIANMIKGITPAANFTGRAV